MTRRIFKLCPFCGGSPCISIHQKQMWGECQRCGSTTDDFSGGNAYRSVYEAWNRRYHGEIFKKLIKKRFRQSIEA